MTIQKQQRAVTLTILEYGLISTYAYVYIFLCTEYFIVSHILTAIGWVLFVLHVYGSKKQSMNFDFGSYWCLNP